MSLKDKAVHKKFFGPTLDLIKKLKRKRQFDLDVPSSVLAFLEQIGFFEEFRSTHTNVELSVDMQDGRLRLKGRGDDFETACNNCSWKLQQIDTTTLEFVDKRIWDVIADTRVQVHMKNILRSKDIKAKVCVTSFDIYFTAAVKFSRGCEDFHYNKRNIAG